MDQFQLGFEHQLDSEGDCRALEEVPPVLNWS
jgi:hypothetical protein